MKKELTAEIVLVTDENSTRRGTIEFRGENQGIMAMVFESRIDAAEKRGEERVIQNLLASVEKLARNP